MVNEKILTIKKSSKQRQKQITSEAGAEVRNTNNNSSNKFNLAIKRKKAINLQGRFGSSKYNNTNLLYEYPSKSNRRFEKV